MSGNGDRTRQILSLGEYQRALERFERCDGFTLPDIRVVIRIDAHRSGPEWQSFPDSGYPFDPQFVRALVHAGHHLLCSGFRIQFAYIHGDEISLLLDRAETMTQRRRTRLASLLASAASVAFVRAFPRAVVFHAVMSELPTDDHVVDYFMWQRKVATRNFLSRTLGLALAAKGMTAQEIDARIGKATDEDKWALLAELGRSQAEVSAYDRLGLALWWEKDSRSDVYRIVECDPVPLDDYHYQSLVREQLGRAAPSIAEEVAAVPFRKLQFEPAAHAGALGGGEGAVAAEQIPAPRPSVAPAPRLPIGQQQRTAVVDVPRNPPGQESRRPAHLTPRTGQPPSERSQEQFRLGPKPKRR